MPRLAGRLAFALLSGAALLVVVPTVAAQADGGMTALPISSFYQIVADPAHDHLFISQGSNNLNDIIVTNLQGQEVATIGGQDGVMGIALSPDGSTLYAAVAGDHAVSAVSTSTLEQTASYPIGDANTPRDVAVQAGKVWVSYNTDTAGGAAIGDINLAASPPEFETQAAMGGWYSAPDLVADPRDSGVLVAAQPGIAPPSEASYDVLTDPVTVIASDPADLKCSWVTDLAIFAGGAKFVLACGAAALYQTSDLSQEGILASRGGASAVAVDANGDVASGGSQIYVYPQGGDVPLTALNLEPSGAIPDRGLAWSPDGSQLFAVLITPPRVAAQPTYALDVLDSPTQPASQLSLSGPSSITIGQSVTLSGSLTAAPASAAFPAGTLVTIVRSLPGAAPDETRSVPIGADGSFSLADTPPSSGDFTYLASYGGSATAGPATSAPFTVAVNKNQTSLTVTAGAPIDNYGTVVTVTAQVGPTDTNRTVSIVARTFGSAFYTVLATGEVNASGDLTATARATQNTQFSAVFTGDADYAPSTVTTDILVRAGVSAALTGYYQTRYSHHIYRVYHRKHALRIHAAVSPDKAGECVSIQTQKYYRGAWHAAGSRGCHALSTASTWTANFGLRHATIGSDYRIRVRYAGDISNLAADSSWQYYIVKR
ncbi:MAG TPA: Ig-like domain-containing protein [Streptosporangiaceae bacterium]|nr:Ig-like domain-containing protein [Streptosporangiaceae bacterium]